MTMDHAAWRADNRDYLVALLSWLHGVLRGEDREDQETGLQADGRAAAARIEARMVEPPALVTLCETFGLSTFDRNLVLLCAGVELDVGVATSVADAIPGAQPCPTVSYALATLPDPDWHSISPDGPLRRWGLVDVTDGATLASSPMRIDERVLHHLLGIDYIDQRLDGLVKELRPGEEPPAFGNASADLVHILLAPNARAQVVHLTGGDPADLRGVALAATQRLGVGCAVILADSIPVSSADRARLRRLWEREAALASLVLVVDAQESTTLDLAAIDFIESAATPVIVTARRPMAVPGARTATVHVPPLSHDERRELWVSALSRHGLNVNGSLSAVSGQFGVGPTGAARVAAEVARTVRSRSSEEVERRLREVCRTDFRRRFDGLAQRLEDGARLDDVVLPPAQHELLREVAVHVRNRRRVLTDWGFAAHGRRGLGTTALFAGPSGTGKTMAAEALSAELGLDAYRIDLSQVVSKYIGETEKNLARLFDAAEASGAILLFDEADALFGKRSEVKDSHDRYANIEVSYLLQRMEAYDGLAILTTNLKSALDQAFLRRIRFVVQFPFPDVAARAQIWRGVFPDATPTQGLDLDKLARLNVPGGTIRTIAVNAAYRAADDDHPVGMGHILAAARLEATKLERPLAATEVGDWVPKENVR